MAQQVSQYSDINQSSTTSKPLQYGLNSIVQSIQNIISTPIGSRFFEPEFGSRIPEMLFEIQDDTTEIMIINEAYASIQRWEPRVQIDFANSSVTADYDHHTYEMIIAFHVRGLQASEDSIQYFTTTLQQVFK